MKSHGLAQARKRRERDARRHDAELLRALEHLGPPDVPVFVEATTVAIDVRLWRLVRCVWCVWCATCVPEEERAPRLRDAQVVQVGDGLVGEVSLEVIALVGGCRRLDVVLIA